MQTIKHLGHTSCANCIIKSKNVAFYILSLSPQNMALKLAINEGRYTLSHLYINELLPLFLQPGQAQLSHKPNFHQLP